MTLSADPRATDRAPRDAPGSRSRRPRPPGPVALRAGVSALALALGACAANPDEPRATVYHALADTEIRAHMRQLSDELGTLVELTLPSAPADAARRAKVLASLDRIGARARRVGGDGVVTNYSVVNDYMDGFLADVALAREFASREPANLVPAQRLVHSCLACHGSI